MIKTTFEGKTVFILNDPPNWKLGFDTQFAAITDSQAGLTKIEARRPYTMFLRLQSCRFSCTLSDDGLISFQGQIRQLTDQNVILPFWPAVEYWENRANQQIGGGLYIAWKADWSQYEIYATDAEPAWPAAGDLVAPAAMGFLKTNATTPISPKIARWSFDFQESSPAVYALSATPNYDAYRVSGPKPTGYTVAPEVFPFTPDWSVVAESLAVDVKREQVGFERPAESTFYPHDVYRVNESSYTLSDGLIGNILDWFNSMASQGASFWTTGSLIAARLASPALAGDTTLTLVDASGLLVNDYVSTSINGTIYFARISTIVGNVLTLDTALGIALPASWDLSQLCLARLDKPQLKLTWRSPTLVKATIRWQEVRSEKETIASETIGTTTGQLQTRAALLHFSRDFGNGSELDFYYTSAEVDINYDGHLWKAAPFEVGEISSGLNMENDSCDVKTFVFPGNPILDEVSLNAEAPMTLTVLFLQFNGSDWVLERQVFSGDCTTTSRDGNTITISGQFGSSLFETDLPRFVRGRMCNHLGGSNNAGLFLISAGCTLLKADWKFTASVANPISSAYPFTLNLSALTGSGASAIAALAATAVFENWFANGWIEFGTGTNLQRRLIVGSSSVVAGVLSLSLHRYAATVPTLGDTVVLFPGCDGLYPTCKPYNSVTNPLGKFNNKVNFGGEPHTPIANPSASGLPSLQTQGGKK